MTEEIQKAYNEGFEKGRKIETKKWFLFGWISCLIMMAIALMILN